MIEGEGPAPSLVLALVQRLPDNSMTSALASGGKHTFQWGVERHMIADLYDAVNLNTKATGQWKKGKAPEFPAWPRPKSKPTEDRAQNTRTSVSDLYAKFTSRR